MAGGAQELVSLGLEILDRDVGKGGQNPAREHLHPAVVASALSQPKSLV